MKWYYHNGEKTVGPLAYSSIIELRACDMISDETQVREESSEEWVRFDQVFGHKDPSKTNSPATITADVIKFHCTRCQQKISAESARAGQNVRCPACEVELTIPDPESYIEVKPNPETPKATLCEVPASSISGLPKTNLQPDTSQNSIVQNKSQKTYYVIKDGDQSGPYTIHEIMGKVEAGEFSNDDLCWTKGMTDWESIAIALDGSSASQSPPPPPIMANPRVNSTESSLHDKVAALLQSTQHSHRTISWITALVSFCLSTAFIVIVDFAIMDGEEVDAARIALVGLPIMILAVIFTSLLHYKCWNSLPQQFRTTTPGKAVGFMFIPFFNFYWAFISWPKLSEGLTNWQNNSGIKPTHTRGLGISFAILFICHFIIALIAVPALAVLLKIALLVIFILYYRNLVRGFNQMLDFSQKKPEPITTGFWKFKRTATVISIAIPLYWVILGANFNPKKTHRPSNSEVALPGWYVAVQNMCKSCEGKGVIYQRCGTCRSMGTLTTRSGYVTACPTCGGTGTVAPTCSYCGGSGQK